MRIKATGKGYAACANHALQALDHMDGTVAKIRKVPRDDGRYSCHCGQPADYFLVEYEDG